MKYQFKLCYKSQPLALHYLNDFISGKTVRENVIPFYSYYIYVYTVATVL